MDSLPANTKKGIAYYRPGKEIPVTKLMTRDEFNKIRAGRRAVTEPTSDGRYTLTRSVKPGEFFFIAKRKVTSKTKAKAKKRVLAVVGVRAKKGELVYYKDGKLYAVEAKRGGTKGAKRKRACTSSRQKASTINNKNNKDMATKKKRSTKKSATRKKTARKRTARKTAKRKTTRKKTAKRKTTKKRTTRKKTAKRRS